jgi:hypothetical protein
MNIVKTEDVRSVTEMKDVEGDETAMEDGWDSITLQ